jgi:hypothetical protein
VDPRFVTPGKKGYGGLDSLAKGMFEQRDSSYEQIDLLEENRIHSIGQEISSLIEGLEKSELKKNEIQTQ